jgi:YesN/AraC family two-component response regulator
VLSAAAGDEALQTSARHAGTIHLLMTDVVMPRMSGRALAQELAKARPTVKILYMSGYADNAFVHNGMIDEGTNFIGKPFTPSELERKVREILDSNASAPPDEAISASDTGPSPTPDLLPEKHRP